MALTKISRGLLDTGVSDSSDATAITIDSSENVGIGETSPLGKIHAKVSDTGASASAQGNLLVLEDTENGLSILSGTSAAGYINFGDSDDNDIGMIIYDHSANAMRFWTNAAERMRIDSSGVVDIIGGNLKLGSGANRNLMYRSANSDVLLEAASGLFYRQDIGNTNHSWFVGNSERMRIDSSGRVSIGDSNPSFKLEVVGNAGTDGSVSGLKDAGNAGSNRDYIRFYNASSAIAGRIEHTSSTGVTYVTSSDYRMKENIRPLENGLSRLQQLKPVKFDWIENKESCEGFIAHEVDEIFTDAVAGKKDGEEMQGVDYGRITPLLVKAIQEQQEEIEQLKQNSHAPKTIEEMEGYEDLINRIKELENK